MASKHVEDAVEAYLVANWDRCPILTENAPKRAAPADGSAFLRLQFPAASTERVTLDPPVYREEGGFRIVINVESGVGTTKIRDWGEEIAALFRDATFGGVHCLAPTEPFTDDESDRGNYFAGAMVVLFWRSFSG